MFRCPYARCHNDALQERDSVLRLNEPKSAVGTDCVIACVPDDGAFRLTGHAAFDIIFGYGSAGVNNDPAISGTLGPSVQETPANAVGMLGWDLRLLQQGRYKPVQNALYGNSGNRRLECGDAGATNGAHVTADVITVRQIPCSRNAPASCSAHA
jgi:hypothetical protein